jgi:hypothetical protein
MLINCGLQISDCGFKDQKFMHHFKQSEIRNPKSEIIPNSIFIATFIFNNLSA